MATDGKTNNALPVSHQLRQLRQAKGWSLRDAERHSDVSNGYISQIERGDVEPSPGVLRRLAMAYDVPTEVLMEAAGFISRRESGTQDREKVPAFVFSAAEEFDEADWDIAQAFFKSMLDARKKRAGAEQH